MYLNINNMKIQLILVKIDFPVAIVDIPKISEKKNNIAVNVFGYENKITFPIFLSAKCSEKPLNLLLISNDTNQRYVYIKDFDRFMYNKTNHRSKIFCMSCLQCFTTKEILDDH